MDTGARFPNGYYRARAVNYDIGRSSGGNEEISVQFELLEDPWKGQHVTWRGYFTEKAKKFTLDALRNCGWSNDDLANIEGLGSTEVSLTIEEEEYDGKTFSKVKWVNSTSSFSVKSPMSPAEKKVFAAKMKADAVASRTKGTVAPVTTTQTKRGIREDDNVPF